MSDAAIKIKEMGLRPSELWEAAWEYASLTNPRTADDGEEEQFWQEYAPHYDERSPLATLAGELMEDIYSLLDKKDRLLEVGAGTGAFTKLLAPRVGSVAVVEPSPSMYAQLAAAWPAAMPLPEVITAKWEDAPVTPGQADVLFSANAVYRIRDMKRCLQRMDMAAARCVILVQSVGRPYANPLALEADGQYMEKERADAISDILHELGIPHVCKAFPVKRKEGVVHDVALIHWSSQR